MEATKTPVLQTLLRLLTFRASREEMQHLDNRHLLLGLACTWLVGIGRSWDNTDAGVLQHLGIGSLAYVFALALLLWVTIKPFAAPGYSYRQMLTFICLVSPPGLLYAIPVEMLFTTNVARNINLIFLLIVATWRVALLVFYLRQIIALRWGEVVVTTLLPLAIIMTPLALFRFMEAVAMGMGGLRGGPEPIDTLEQVLDILGLISVLAFLPLLSIYISMTSRLKNRSPLLGSIEAIQQRSVDS